MKYITIYETDDTDSFGHHLAKVKLKDAEKYTIIKAIFHIGPYSLIVENPIFPFYVDLTGEETKLLYRTNECYLELFDGFGKKRTIDLKTIIEVKKRG